MQTTLVSYKDLAHYFIIHQQVSVETGNIYLQCNCKGRAFTNLLASATDMNLCEVMN